MRPRSVLSALATLLLVLLVPPFAGTGTAASTTAAFVKTSEWGSGWEGKFTLTNGSNSAINGWQIQFDLPAGTTVGTFWDALLTTNQQHQTFRNREYNETIPPGGSVSFGLIAAGSGSPQNCAFNGAACGGGEPGDPGDPGELGAPGTPAITARTNSSLTLSWTAGSGAPTGYRVFEGGTPRTTVSGTTATLTGLQTCSTHTYTVKAFNADGESGASGAVAGTTSGCATSALPRHLLTGYWHNFDNPARELRLSEIPDHYDLIAVAFGEATTRAGEVTFRVDPGLSASLGGYTDAQFKADVRGLRARGKSVILSVGGQNGTIQVNDAASATLFADSVQGLINDYGFDGVDIDLENVLNPAFMEQALRRLRSAVGSGLIITMAPQTIDMQSTAGSYFQLALRIKDILTVVNMQYYNSGSMLGCDQKVYGQGSIDFITALACIQLENGLRPDQVAVGLPAGQGAAGSGIVPPSTVNNALDCLARGTNCGSFRPPRTYPDIRGAMTWSINWDVTNGNGFARTVGPHLDTLP
jgi:chitinase